MAKMGNVHKTVNATCWQTIGANQDSETLAGGGTTWYNYFR